MELTNIQKYYLYLFNKPNKKHLIIGGRKTGMSSAVLNWIINDCANNKNKNNIFISGPHTLNVLNNFIHSFDIKNNIQGIVNKTIIQFKNESNLYCFEYSKIHNNVSILRGINFDNIVVDYFPEELASRLGLFPIKEKLMFVYSGGYFKDSDNPLAKYKYYVRAKKYFSDEYEIEVF